MEVNMDKIVIWVFTR